MTAFVYGGEVFRILDLDAEMTPSVNYKERIPTFEEKAMDEILLCTPEELENRFLVVYSSYCEAVRTVQPQEILRLSLAGQKSVYSPQQRILTMCNVLMVFVQNKGKFEPLWKITHFQNGKHYPFLNKVDIETLLQPTFGKTTIKLGLLEAYNTPAIAWQVEAKEDTFYISWHNGCIFPKEPNFVFTEKTLSELKKTYSVLRFLPSYLGSDVYKVGCC